MADESNSSNYMEKAQLNDKKVTVLKKEDIYGLNEEENETLNMHDVTRISGKKWFNNPLIPMRGAVFLWYGAARIPGSFLSLFMKQRGMSLVQFSSVFSVIFAFQLLCATVSGIIADKIGNAKPVLMFHILATITIIICMLLVPSVSSGSPMEDKIICFDGFGVSRNNLSSCNFTCSENNTGRFLFRDPVSDFEMTSNFSSTSVLSLCKLSNHVQEITNSMHCSSRDLNGKSCSEIDGNCTILCLNTYENYNRSSETKYVFIYTILMLLFFSFWTTVYRFMDVTIMSLVKKYDSNFGKERFVSLMGELFIAILTSFVLDTSTPTNSRNNYDSVYWVCAGVMFLCFLAVYCIRAQINPPGRRLWKKAFKLIRNLDVMVFFAAVFVMGNGFCFNLNFHMWFLDYLKAPKVLFGLHVVCFSMYGLPLLFTSKWWLKKLQPPKIFVLSLVCYTISGISYSFLYNPWLSLMIESTSAFTYHLLWVAVVVHSHSVAPKGLVATVTAVSGTIHFGIGRTTGVVSGGLLISAFGPRITYRILASVCFATAILYSIFLYRRPISMVKDSELDGKEVDLRKSLCSNPVSKQ